MIFESSQVSVVELMGRAENRFSYRWNIQLLLTWKRNFPAWRNNQETQETKSKGVAHLEPFGTPSCESGEVLRGSGARCEFKNQAQDLTLA